VSFNERLPGEGVGHVGRWSVLRITELTGTHKTQLHFRSLCFILLTWRMWWAPNNASRWQMGFNSAFKGLAGIHWLLAIHLRPLPVEHRYIRGFSLPYFILWSWTQGLVESSWNVMAHGEAREGKWRGNWWMEWVASTLHTTSEHGASSITTADAHTSAASSRLNWRPRRFKWTRPFRGKT
jgi:hypothetical protein